MKIGIQTWGSDGDIRPFFALANELRINGHDVTICYTSIDRTDYTDLAEKLNVKSFNVFPNPINDINIIGKQITKTPNALKQCKLVFSNFFEPAVEEMLEASKELCRYNDIVIGHYIQHTLHTAAEEDNITRVTVYLTPIGIPFEFYSPGCSAGHLTLVASSPSLFSRKPDWPENIKICGFFNIPTSEDIWEVPPKLDDFINAGDAPVYVTMGSPDYFQAEENLNLCIDAIKLTKQRAIIQTSDSAYKPVDDPSIFVVNKVPHQVVFPLCSAIVHHGGAGTTQSALLAGRASLVVEHAFDQTFWAQQLNKAGVAEKFLHRRSLTPQKLADGISQIVSSRKYNEKAEKIGAMMRKENGASTAAQLIEEWCHTC